MTDVYLSLGSNIGDREFNLEHAIERLQERVNITARSSFYETEPQDLPDQPWFLNAVLKGETSYSPLELLAFTSQVEKKLGRVRGDDVKPKGPRTLDIDILLFGDQVVNAPELVIPHPRMLERRFVLEPLLEISPQLEHPQTGETLNRYLVEVATQQIRKLGTFE